MALVGQICGRRYTGTPKNPPPGWRPAVRTDKSGRCGAYVPAGQPCWKCGAAANWCRDCRGACKPEHRRELEAAARVWEQAVAS